jgi:hypothetical protein
MSAITLKSLHNYLKLLENASEPKRRLPASSNPRTLKEGLYETSRLIGVDEAVFKDAQIFEVDQQEKAKVDAFMAAR